MQCNAKGTEQVQEQETKTEKGQEQEITPTEIDMEIQATMPKKGGKK